MLVWRYIVNLETSWAAPELQASDGLLFSVA
jgi:hypothetical protein